MPSSVISHRLNVKQNQRWNVYMCRHGKAIFSVSLTSVVVAKAPKDCGAIDCTGPVRDCRCKRLWFHCRALGWPTVTVTGLSLTTLLPMSKRGGSWRSPVRYVSVWKAQGAQQISVRQTPKSVTGYIHSDWTSPDATLFFLSVDFNI